LCAKDSDGDGMTNGEELGDPNCVWTQGAVPSGGAQGQPGKQIVQHSDPTTSHVQV